MAMKEQKKVTTTGKRSRLQGMMQIGLSFLLCHLSFSISSCSSIDCPVQNTVNTKDNLVNADGTTDTLNTDTLWIWSPRANGKASRDYQLDDDDTLLINSLCGPSATSFSIPISYTLPEDTIIFALLTRSGKELLDTILVKKDNQPHFESVDCQASYFHTITNVRWTHNAIDSIAINNPNVNYDLSIEHFHLYLKADR